MILPLPNSIAPIVPIQVELKVPSLRPVSIIYSVQHLILTTTSKTTPPLHKRPAWELASGANLILTRTALKLLSWPEHDTRSRRPRLKRAQSPSIADLAEAARLTKSHFHLINTGVDVWFIILHLHDFITPMVNVPLDIMAAQIYGEGAYKSVPVPYLQPPLRWWEISMPILSHLLNVSSQISNKRLPSFSTSVL